MNRVEWFSTPIYHDFINVGGLKEIVDDIKKHQDGVTISNRGGWQSDDISDDVRLTDLKNTLEQRALHVSKDLIRPGIGTFKMANMWVNFNKKGSYNKIHEHPGCDLSGTVYIKTHKDCGNIFFEDPRFMYRMNEHGYTDLYNKLTCIRAEYIPEDGKLLFFPGWIKHGVEENLTDEYRISIAFNMRMIYEG